MKHLLNNLSEEEKNSILEQHSGGIRVSNNRFKTLLESNLGDVKPLLKENSDQQKYTLLYNSVSGLGTDEEGFFKALYSIRDKNEYNRIDSIAKTKGESIASLFRGDFDDIPSTEKFCGYLNKIGVAMPKDVCQGQLGWMLPDQTTSGAPLR